MKVIKEGKKINSAMRVTCERCEAVLEVQVYDLKWHCGDKRVSCATYRYQCPCCRSINYLEYKDLSEEIRLDLYE